MGEFDEFAAQLRATQDGKEKAHAEKLRAEAEESDRRWHMGRDFLVNNVVPVLEEAKTAFEAQGLRIEITPNWEDETWHMRPAITFKVFGPKKRPHDNSVYEVNGQAASFSHDGFNFKAVLINHSGYREDSSSAGSDVEAIRLNVKRALESYFAKADPSK